MGVATAQKHVIVESTYTFQLQRASLATLLAKLVKPTQSRVPAAMPLFSFLATAALKLALLGNLEIAWTIAVNLVI